MHVIQRNKSRLQHRRKMMACQIRQIFLIEMLINILENQIIKQVIIVSYTSLCDIHGIIVTLLCILATT